MTKETTFISIYKPSYVSGHNGPVVLRLLRLTELSTPQRMFNLGRAIQSEWEVQIQSDGSFAFCSAEIDVIVFGVNSLGSR